MNKKLKKCLLATLFLGQFISAQELETLPIQTNLKTDNQRYRYFSALWESGVHLYSGNQTIRDMLRHGHGAAQVRMGWQTTQKEEWAQYYGYPSFGVGYYSGFVGDPEVFGSPNGFFSFINFPLNSDNKRTTLHLEPALGLTYRLKPYDKVKNPYNDAIGARMGVYFELSLALIQKLIEK